MPNDIDQKIETWKNKLLDLSKRNRLLNYRETKRSTLKLVSPDCVSLWDSFVKEEQPIKFPYYDEYSGEYQEFSPVKTDQTGEDMQKTLRNLRDKTKIAKEEKGTHILYLSFGFLKWKETINTETIFSAPIILVPVHLKIESLASPYTLALHEDEIVVNPTLCYKLKNDFGLDLDLRRTINKNEDIQHYLEEVKKCIATCTGWAVSIEVSLGFLSFFKIHMYHDLNKNKEAIKQNAVIKAINGDRSSLSGIPDEIKDFDYDRQVHPSDTFQVVDADSSQQDAILYAKKGVSFILQGPPGTGKSQTITNIISECLADGKKVLFVAEKKAALDVVHKRLSEAKLNDFCLILHGHKASKRDILDQLEKVLKMGRNRSSMRDEAHERLNTLQKKRKQLNEYVQQLHTKIQPLGSSIFDVNGELAKLESYPSITFDIKGIAIGEVDRETFNNWSYLLKQLANTLGKMSTDSILSPWKGTTLDAISHDLRHNIKEKLPALISQVKDANDTLREIYSTLSLKWERNCVLGLRKLISLLEVANRSPIVPSSWILIDDISSLTDAISKYERLQNDFLLKRKELEEQCIIILTNDLSINRLDISGLNHTDDIKKVLSDIQSYLDHPPYAKWDLTDNRLFSLRKEAEEQSKKLNDLLSFLSSTFDDGIFDIDYNGIYNRYKTEYTSFLKIFKRNYKNDRNAVRRCHKTIVKRVQDRVILDTVSKLCTIAESRKWLEEHQQELQDYFGNLYAAEKTDFGVLSSRLIACEALHAAIPLLNDMYSIALSFERQRDDIVSQYQQFYQGLVGTDWGQVKERLSWATDFRKHIQENNLNNDFVEVICSKPEASAKCGQFMEEVQSILGGFDGNEGKWFLSLFVQEEKESLLSLELPALQDRLEKCSRPALLEEWIDFKHAREDCRNKGLADYIRQVEDLHINKDNIVPVFKKQFFKSWLDKVSVKYPAVLRFRKDTHENIIHEFSQLDKEQFVIAQLAIKCKLIEKLPNLESYTNSRDELGILTRELNKKRNIMPVRQLFKEIPTLLPTLKPCLMMSPFSVSLFLEADSYLFDTVIFDEASQICTENAIGAILRGEQVIIAGDQHQLPPTNFFAKTALDSDYDGDDEELDNTNDYESILDEAYALPERTLLWHYRSRHEHLIAFSNAKIYKDKLITFPSNIDRSPDNGVEYIFVEEGFYNSEGKKKKRNVPEAERVAELVFEHFREHPERSLGVIAFSDVQQQAIETALRAKRWNVQYNCYEPFFDEERDEPFFVKNLENVQGDERDTIIFSIGYAKSETGVFHMNFGPLSKPGGERRLNVAITRAKFNVKLVGSIHPTDIDLKRVSNEGPKLLREYIAFAQRGMGALTNEVTTSDSTKLESPFEESVYHFLERRGYKLKTQVGCSGYRIDMAVEHPTLSGIYVLGIECDGATYHSSRTARERDRLRQDVLERMGWRIYRIWSTDWIKDVTTAGEKLISVIQEAISTHGEEETPHSEGKTVGNANDFTTDIVPVLHSEPQENRIQNLFEEHKEIDIEALLSNNALSLTPADWIRRVVDNEYPVHYERLCQKVSPALGKKKVTTVIRRDVDAALKEIGCGIFRKGNFFFPSKETKIIPRIPTTRKIDHISTEEIATAMATILTHCIGRTSKDYLCTETVRAYGFQRSGANISSAMEEAFNLLIQSGKAKMVGDKVVAVST